ncbi:hypothetical protein GCM10007394_21080 [Salinibacterium amurskyense]|nr:hypothetical protein GCM10007394_21080 [Salinibacterium amurskyense]
MIGQVVELHVNEARKRTIVVVEVVARSVDNDAVLDRHAHGIARDKNTLFDDAFDGCFFYRLGRRKFAQVKARAPPEKSHSAIVSS